VWIRKEEERTPSILLSGKRNYLSFRPDPVCPTWHKDYTIAGSSKRMTLTELKGAAGTLFEHLSPERKYRLDMVRMDAGGNIWSWAQYKLFVRGTNLSILI